MEQEIAALKTQVQRQGVLLRWSLGGWALGAALLLMGSGKATEGQTSPQELKLRRLALVDAKGVERVVLEADRTEIRMDGQVIKTKTARHGLTIHKSPMGTRWGASAFWIMGTLPWSWMATRLMASESEWASE